MSMLPPVFIELKANASEFTTAMGEARGEVAKLEKQGSGSFDKLAAVGKASLFAISTAAIAVGAMGLKMADEFEQSHAKLQTALKNTGTSFEKLQDPIGIAQKRMEGFGFTNAQTQEALANLTTALGDPKKALDSLGMAADLAKYKHVDLATAAVAVAKAQEGNLKALKQLGIDLPIASSSAAALAKAQETLGTQTQKAKTFLEGHSDAMQASSPVHTVYMQMLDKVSASQDKVNSLSSAGTNIMDALGKKIGGQASASADTFAGKLLAVKAQSEDVAKNIGLILIPIVEKLMTATKNVVDWLAKHKAIAEALAIVIGGAVAIAITAYIVQMGLAAAASIAAGVAAAGAAAAAAAAWVVASGGTILIIAAIVAAVVLLVKHWHTAWSGMKKAFDVVWDGIKAVASGIGNFFVGIFDGIRDTIKNSINGFISLINGAIHLINSLPHVKILGVNFGLPHISDIPQLAEGGVVNRPTLAVIGEAGPEAVVPLSKMNSMGGSGINVTVHVNGSVTSEHDLAVTIRDNIAQMMRRKGLSPSILGV